MPGSAGAVNEYVIVRGPVMSSPTKIGRVAARSSYSATLWRSASWLLNWIRTSDPAGTVMVRASNAYPRATSSITTGSEGAVVGGSVVPVTIGDVGSAVAVVGTAVVDLGSTVGVVVPGPGPVVQPARSRQTAINMTNVITGACSRITGEYKTRPHKGAGDPRGGIVRVAGPWNSGNSCLVTERFTSPYWFMGDAPRRLIGTKRYYPWCMYRVDMSNPWLPAKLPPLKAYLLAPEIVRIGEIVYNLPEDSREKAPAPPP